MCTGGFSWWQVLFTLCLWSYLLSELYMCQCKVISRVCDSGCNLPTSYITYCRSHIKSYSSCWLPTLRPCSIPHRWWVWVHLSYLINYRKNIYASESHFSPLISLPAVISDEKQKQNSFTPKQQRWSLTTEPIPSSLEICLWLNF